ncbi:Developmental protein SEPALLATA [Arachis hypogaea]|nr:Developmental protein SEPALLATA [Arachis hypogaea]
MHQYAAPHNAHSSQGIFQPLECNPTLQIGSDYMYNGVGPDQITATTTTTQAQQVSGFIPGWML